MQMLQNKTTIRFLVATLGINALGGLSTLIFFGYSSFINLELAYLLTMLIVISTFFTYKTRLKNAQSDYKIEDETDELDKIDDKHGLYEETKEEASEIKEKQKSFTWSRALLGSKLFFSIYRLLAYLFLIIAVMVLIKNGVFEALSFIAGTTLFVVSVIIFYLLSFDKRLDSE